ncbi:hypothetical protein KKF34_04415 [Myxococcota bacterium]|nr:hypothetical protein [Myxococcota bacterium]MBU1496102.1 hypothetical protein [Myxococcota bacterium]
MTQENIFKKCPSCGKTWETRDDFLRDWLLKVNGYVVDFETLEYGLYYFTHMVEGCFSTMVIETGKFIDLFDGERYEGNHAGQPGCPLYCLDNEQFSRCDQICECAFFREVLRKIIEYPKT